ncbi:MAG TPA: hypothetical protein VGP33_12410 [Chloroflexota bacterium]|nr:hypothetical protein [Chloroflexota bacterium]
MGISIAARCCSPGSLPPLEPRWEALDVDYAHLAPPLLTAGVGVSMAFATTPLRRPLH